MATLIDIEEDGRLEDENNTAEFDAVDSQEQPTEEDLRPCCNRRDEVRSLCGVIGDGGRWRGGRTRPRRRA